MPFGMCSYAASHDDLGDAFNVSAGYFLPQVLSAFLCCSRSSAIEYLCLRCLPWFMVFTFGYGVYLCLRCLNKGKHRKQKSFECFCEISLKFMVDTGFWGASITENALPANVGCGAEAICIRFRQMIFVRAPFGSGRSYQMMLLGLPDLNNTESASGVSFLVMAWSRTKKCMG